ncbi:MAG: HAD-IA family hydrolase [Chitinivibrionales bacterium]|nr:HAD-IA family hydrolase [Chitinivibrionales bacterium]
MSARHGLIFDVDGVIADTEAVNAAASIRMFRELFELTGVKREDFAAGLGRGAAAYVRAAADKHGLTLSDEQVERATARRQQLFLEMLAENPLPAFPGVLELMNAALSDEAWRVAIATSSTREKSIAVLQSARVPVERMAYVTGSDVTHKKPDPELFLTAAGRLAIEPGTCVVIEDAPDGVAAAHAAGCRCVAVTNSAPADALSAAERVVASLTEVGLDELRQMLQS